MIAACPLQGPGQVCIGAGLEELLMYFLDPLRVELEAKEPRPAEGIRLENSECQQGEDCADHQEDKGLGDEILDRTCALPASDPDSDGSAGLSRFRLEIADHQRDRKHHRHGNRIQLGGGRHAEGDPKGDRQISKRISEQAQQGMSQTGSKL